MGRWPWPLLSILLLVALASSACGSGIWFAPSRPWAAGYVMTENGALVAKLVCGEFQSVQVQQQGRSASTPLWSAQSRGSGAASLPLFQAQIEGYTVESKGVLDRGESALMTFERMDGVLGGSVEFVPSSLKEDEVAFQGGVVKRAEFDRMSRQDFGCMR
jgi:hypothetical protein